MKTSKQCPKCKSLRIGHIETQLDLAHAGPAPGHVGQGPGSIWRHEYVGELESYVCTECGHRESYVKDPGAVRWDRIKGFRWVNEDPGDGSGPFR